ncbi:MAG: hypothetical protein Q4G26_09500, partial [Paracoccus sp. (in: a-proteobacteria)]|nr:hypothetical protein [Paracoccus sp. (in: a-proteobacteria)]
MLNSPHAAELLHAAHSLTQFTDWLTDSGDDLINATKLLGGPKWLPTALRVIHAAKTGDDLGEMMPSLRRLRRLLNLEYVDDLRSD